MKSSSCTRGCADAPWFGTRGGGSGPGLGLGLRVGLGLEGARALGWRQGWSVCVCVLG